ncbi:TauD/TfdA family dioxygenase [Micromonospora sp. RTGN7]|uniref:TauD/TfdA family dioxygenase n=1 Tax=Micromonospora sp. RTGN7 TaxID=3016526 RepID=UPI0029FECD34|nr:TauD/TfdA family dioxygenase [Micromonospora sp. RTGN7]
MIDTRTPTFRTVPPGTPFRVPVRGRAYLAGSTHENFPESVPDIGDTIPTLMLDRAASAGPQLAAAVRDAVDEALPTHGGVLLRGLPLTDRAGFETLVAGLGYDLVGYRGGIAVRRNDSAVALHASDEDARVTLSPHNEMAYLPRYPRKIFFFCEKQAERGGEVPVNDIRRTAELIPASVLDEFRERGVRYHRNLPRTSTAGETGWLDTFGTDDRSTVEEHLRTSGYECTWNADGRLRYHYRRDAFVTHPVTGEELWFNQVTELNCSYWRAHPGFPADLPDDDYPATTTYGDGAPIPPELVSYLRGVLWRTTRAVRMRAGDVLALDNQVLQHGRFAYEGVRQHYVSLTS